jgi:hypothetical protein
MKVMYEALFRLDDLRLTQPNQGAQLRIELPNGRGIGTITTSPDDLAFRIDEAGVLRRQLLTGGIREPTTEFVAERRRVRREAWSGAAFLHFAMAADGQLLPDRGGAVRREFAAFSVGLDDVDVRAVEAQREPSIDAIFAALRLSGHLFVPQFMGDITYEAGPPLTYHFQFRFGEATLSVIKPLGEVSHVEVLAGRLLDLRHLPGLLADSYTLPDPFRAFFSAWLGLEKFTNSYFDSRYNARWTDRLHNGQADLPPKFLTNQPRQDKYTLVGKFRIITLILSPETADRDTDEMRALHSARRLGVHEDGPGAERWPVARARALLEKYLRLHLNDRG